MGTRMLYIQGSDGKMQGSRPLPAAPPASGALAEARQPAGTAESDRIDYELISDVLSQAADEAAAPPGPSWLVVAEDGTKSVHVYRLAEDLACGDAPALVEARKHAISLDYDQRVNVLASAAGSLMNARGFSLDSALAPASQVAWDAWHREQAERLAEEQPDLAAAYAARVGGPPASALEFDAMRSAPDRARHAVKALEREVRYLAGYHDIDVADATAAFQAARRDYQRMTREEQSEAVAPEWFTRATKDWYMRVGRGRKPPLDRATAYALHDVLTNPDRTAPYRRTGMGVVVFDTETTGVDHDSKILQVTCVHYDSSGREVQRISTHIHPGEEADGSVYVGGEQAVAAHGITPQMLHGKPSFAEVAPQIRAMMEGRTIAGHNVMFDYPKIQRALANAGEPLLSSGRIIDTLRLAQYATPPGGRGGPRIRYTLSDSCERAGLPFDPELAHDAEYDVDRTAALLFALRRSPLGASPS